MHEIPNVRSVFLGLTLLISGAVTVPAALGGEPGTEREGTRTVPSFGTPGTILKHAETLTRLLELLKNSDLSLKGLIQPETMPVELSAEASNNQVEAFNGNRAQILSGNTNSVSVLSNLNIQVRINISSDGAPGGDKRAVSKPDRGRGTAGPDKVKKSRGSEKSAAEPAGKPAKEGKSVRPDPASVRDLREEFDALDADGDGVITWREYREAWKRQREAQSSSN
jgi:hypothetical protein